MLCPARQLAKLLVQCELDAITFLIASGPCRVHENPPHDTGSHGQKVRPVLAVHLPDVNQTEVSLVDERRSRECGVQGTEAQSTELETEHLRQAACVTSVSM